MVSEHRTLMMIFAGALLLGLVCAAFSRAGAVARVHAADVQSGIQPP